MFEFAYKTIDNVVIETDATEPDGTHTVFRFANRQVVLEIYDARGKHPKMVSLDRGNDGQVTGVTVRCESNGRRVTRTAEVTAGNREAVTQSLIAQECSRGQGAP